VGARCVFLFSFFGSSLNHTEDKDKVGVIKKRQDKERNKKIRRTVGPSLCLYVFHCCYQGRRLLVVAAGKDQRYKHKGSGQNRFSFKDIEAIGRGQLSYLSFGCPRTMASVFK
jgi:hypothetical protein